MVSEIRIQNLRSLRDTGFIKLKPINILVGVNSSGKSTFLRSFLLLAQSVTKRLRLPIAWFDDSLVDFGDFETSKNRNAADNENIVFSFRMQNVRLCRVPFPHRYNSRYDLPVQKEIPNMELSIYYGIKENKDTHIKKIDIKFDTAEVELELSNHSDCIRMRVDGREAESILYNWQQGVDFGLLPMLRIESGSKITSGSLFELPSMEKILAVLKNACGKRFSNVDRLQPIINMWDLDKEEFLKKIKLFDDIKSLRNRIVTWTVETPEFLRLYDGIMGLYLYEIWSSVNSELGVYFENCDYVAPLRAEARRYYRNQGLQVSRIDSYGRNLSEFIDSLTLAQRQSYNDYIGNMLGINIVVKNNTGHQTINLQKKGKKGKEYNIADVGFGYSQILPIVTKLWYVQERARFRSWGYFRQNTATSLIEQPELHLHPALQAKLADALMKATLMQDKSKFITNFIVETHSPTIINRMGRRVREGNIDAGNVNILIFDKDDESGDSKVWTTQFNEKGQIEKWPWGFFDPEDDDF